MIDIRFFVEDPLMFLTKLRTLLCHSRRTRCRRRAAHCRRGGDGAARAELLETRWLLSCSATVIETVDPRTEEPVRTLEIIGDDGANSVEVDDEEPGGATVTCEGRTLIEGAMIDRVDIRTFGGADTINYRLVGNPDFRPEDHRVREVMIDSGDDGDAVTYNVVPPIDPDRTAGFLGTPDHLLVDLGGAGQRTDTGGGANRFVLDARAGWTVFGNPNEMPAKIEVFGHDGVDQVSLMFGDIAGTDPLAFGVGMETFADLHGAGDLEEHLLTGRVQVPVHMHSALGDGDDLFRVDGTPLPPDPERPDQPLTIDALGGDGADTFQAGGGAWSQLTLDGQGGLDFFDIFYGTPGWRGPVALMDADGTGRVMLHGTEAADSFLLNEQGVTLTPGPDDDRPAERVSFFDVFAEITLDTAGGDDTAVLEHIAGGASSPPASWTVFMDTGFDRLSVIATQLNEQIDVLAAADQGVGIDWSDADSGAALARIDVSGVEDITIKAGDGNDEFNVNGRIAAALHLFGQGGEDSAHVPVVQVLHQDGGTTNEVGEPELFDGGEGNDKFQLITTDAAELIEILGVPDVQIPDPLIRVTDLATNRVTAEWHIVNAEEITVDMGGGDDTAVLDSATIGGVGGVQPSIQVLGGAGADIFEAGGGAWSQLTLDGGADADFFDIFMIGPPDDGMPVQITLMDADGTGRVMLHGTNDPDTFRVTESMVTIGDPNARPEVVSFFDVFAEITLDMAGGDDSAVLDHTGRAGPQPHLNVLGGGGADRITVRALPYIEFTLDGGADADFFDIFFVGPPDDSIPRQITLMDADGTGRVMLHGTDDADSFRVTQSMVTIGDPNARPEVVSFFDVFAEITLDMAGGDDFAFVDQGLKGILGRFLPAEMIFDGGAGRDTFTVLASPFGDLTLDGGADADFFDISFGDLAGPVHLRDADRGTEVLLRGTEADESFLIAGGMVTRNLATGAPELVDLGEMEPCAKVLAGAGMDRVTVMGGRWTELTLDGGEQADLYDIRFGMLGGPVHVLDSGTVGQDSVMAHATAAADTLTLSAGLPLIVKWEGPDLNETGNDVAIETIEIDHRTLEVLDLDAGAGGDVIDASQFQPDISSVIQLILRGGDGNDQIKGSQGADILLGEAGDDLLLGLGGRDVMIGGTGSDRLVGGNGDDILIAGATDHDAHDAALFAILAEWNSARDYNTRIANLMGTGTGADFANRLNGQFFLNDRTVHDDGAADTLTGAAGRDWFLYNADGDGGAKDKVTDLQGNEIASDIDAYFAAFDQLQGL